jgi:hypothetical protein
VINILKVARPMRNKKKGSTPSPRLQERLSELEREALRRGFHLHYDRLEAAGLKLKDGLCKMKGEYHIFVDKRKSIAEKINTLLDYLDQPLPEEPPQEEHKEPGAS